TNQRSASIARKTSRKAPAARSHASSGFPAICHWSELSESVIWNVGAGVVGIQYVPGPRRGLPARPCRHRGQLPRGGLPPVLRVARIAVAAAPPFVDLLAEVLQDEVRAAPRRLAEVDHPLQLPLVTRPALLIVQQVPMQVHTRQAGLQPFPCAAAVFPHGSVALEEHERYACLAWRAPGALADHAYRYRGRHGVAPQDQRHPWRLFHLGVLAAQQV